MGHEKPARAAPSGRDWIIFVAAVAVVGTGVFLAARLRHGAVHEAPAAKPTVAAPASQPSPAPQETPAQPVKPLAAPPTLPIGGRSVDWWKDRLSELRNIKTAEGQRLFDLTRERAERNGIQLKDAEGILELTASVPAVAPIAPPASASLSQGAFQVSISSEPGRPRVLMAPRPTSEAALMVVFHAGSYDDGNFSGLTRLSQHALLEANRRADFTELVMALRKAGGTLHLGTGVRDCSFLLVAPKQDFARLAPRVLQMLLDPIIDEDRFHTALERTSLDDLEPGRGEDLLTLVASLASNDLEYKNKPYGDPAQIEHITPDQVRAHLDRALSPANATVVAAGGFDPALLRQTNRFRRGVRAPVAPLRVDLPIESSFGAFRETHIFSYPLHIETFRQAASARVLAQLAEERILSRFRRQGIGYSLLVRPFHARWLDLFMIELPAHDPGNLDLGPVLKQSVAELREEKLDDGEFARSRSGAWERLRAIDSNPVQLAKELSSGAEGPWYGPEVAEAVRSLDRAEFAAARSAWLAESNLIHVEFSPRAKARIIVSGPVSRSRP